MESTFGMSMTSTPKYVVTWEARLGPWEARLDHWEAMLSVWEAKISA